MRLAKPNEQFEDQIIINIYRGIRIPKKFLFYHHSNKPKSLILTMENVRNKAIFEAIYEYFDNKKCWQIIYFWNELDQLNLEVQSEIAIFDSTVAQGNMNMHEKSRSKRTYPRWKYDILGTKCQRTSNVAKCVYNGRRAHTWLEVTFLCICMDH